MWAIFLVCFVLWFVSVEYSFPAAVIITFFAAMLGSAAWAVYPSEQKQERDHSPFDTKRLYTRW